jgi:hypothetical protein
VTVEQADHVVEAESTERCDVCGSHTSVTPPDCIHVRDPSRATLPANRQTL